MRMFILYRKQFFIEYYIIEKTLQYNRTCRQDQYILNKQLYVQLPGVERTIFCYTDSGIIFIVLMQPINMIMQKCIAHGDWYLVITPQR